MLHISTDMDQGCILAQFSMQNHAAFDDQNVVVYKVQLGLEALAKAVCTASRLLNSIAYMLLALMALDAANTSTAM